MQWHELVDHDAVPKKRDFLDFLGEAGPLWLKLDDYIRQSYGIKPVVIFSQRSDHPGWSIQYEKKGQTLCTVYPNEDYFEVLIIIHRLEEEAAKAVVNDGKLSDYTADLFHNSSSSAAGRWLMLEVEHEELLKDIHTLMSVKAKPKIKPGTDPL